METGGNMEKLSKNVNAVTYIEINKLLDELVKKDGYLLKMGDISIINLGIREDTISGKRQVFQITRKVGYNEK